MLNIENLLKAKDKEICILLKYGEFTGIRGILLRVDDNDIILQCKDNIDLGTVNILDSEAHVPVNAVASWFLIKDSIHVN